MKHKKSDRSTQIFSVYYGHSLECHTGSVDVSGSSPLCSTRMMCQFRYWPEKPRLCLVFFVFFARSRRERVTVDMVSAK